jgi:hypothetical protein
MEVENNHALNDNDISVFGEIFSILAEGDYEDHLKNTKLGADIGPLDPASKGPMLEPNNL